MVKPVSPSPNIAPRAGEQKTWTLDDMALLQEQIEGLQAGMLILTDLRSQVTAMETKLVNFEPNEQLLPSEVIAGLSPAQIYQSALQASILGTLMSNPSLHSGKEVHKANHARNCIHFAATVLTEQLKAMPGRGKKTA